MLLFAWSLIGGQGALPEELVPTTVCHRPMSLPETLNMTVWPSGLRRWLQAPVRKGVGSNPTAVSAHGDKKGHQAPAHYARCGPAILRNSPARAPRATYEHQRQTTKNRRVPLTLYSSPCLEFCSVVISWSFIGGQGALPEDLVPPHCVSSSSVSP